MHPGFFLWTLSRHLSRQGTQRPGPRVCGFLGAFSPVPASRRNLAGGPPVCVCVCSHLSGRPSQAGQASLPGAFWCASPFLVLFLSLPCRCFRRWMPWAPAPCGRPRNIFCPLFFLFFRCSCASSFADFPWFPALGALRLRAVGLGLCFRPWVTAFRVLCAVCDRGARVHPLPLWCHGLLLVAMCRASFPGVCGVVLCLSHVSVLCGCAAPCCAFFCCLLLSFCYVSCRFL